MAAFSDIGTSLRSALGQMYGLRLLDCRLFGSHARNEADQESDLDVLIVLDRVDHYAAEVDRTSALIGNLSLIYGISISRVFLTEKEWRESDSPFVQNVRDEAIPA